MDKAYANPATLGLCGFGMTTVLLNIVNAGFFSVDSMLLGMALFYGGTAQVIAGIMAFKRGDMFGTTAFTSYGLFWLSYAALKMLPRMGYADPASPIFMGWWLGLWGVFTGFLAVGSLRYPKAKQVIFFSLTLLFFLLAIGHWADSETLEKIAGWEGMFCGSSAIYFGMALVLNSEFGFELIPVGGPTWDPSKPPTTPQNEPCMEKADEKA